MRKIYSKKKSGGLEGLVFSLSKSEPFFHFFYGWRELEKPGVELSGVIEVAEKHGEIAGLEIGKFSH